DEQQSSVGRANTKASSGSDQGRSKIKRVTSGVWDEALVNL
ncbi:hypothetical protein WICPIJ_007302, partial [Wickerhamomyces pijperi]